MVLDLALAVVGSLILLIWYAFYLSIRHPQATISKRLALWGAKYPALRYMLATALPWLVIGVLFGHWFWPVYLPAE